ncbi:hypothetical protein TSTA_030700 [Talaromyces stipitatus ATCC 10500]|uniref:Uncharacterized protein n=1 Tax=Talaromyces stipitatus (strain ATCC 10500 / CBS 375.48 / QM 6759 / NRRL 1006) TaxID=441959 RepID=B8M7S6_TALSN|nr:uncharacterized protein TSTA_030700 [Talaromyces stipitatus ATCC 10500]EED19805.1 hypothetical protein TSTA_030700 [Talaromyces stipitatus ATCC 10500]
MDTEYEYPIYGWTTTTTHHNETLDLFYHRWQTGREAQEIFLEQNTLFLEAEGGQVQVTGFLITPDDAQVAASWNSLWDEEEEDHKSEEEEDGNSFYYCPSPDKVCSMESSTSIGQIVTGISFQFEDFGRELPLGGGQNYEVQESTMPIPTTPPSHSSPGPSGPSHVHNLEHQEHTNIGKDRVMPTSPCPMLRPSPDRILSNHIDPTKHGMRWEPITVNLNGWEHEFTVLKPYADYTDVPSPIMLPGSPPQRTPKPSLSGFYKVPTVRDPFVIAELSRNSRDKEEPSPPAPPLQFPERIANSKNRWPKDQLRRTNSDVSVIDLGDPFCSMNRGKSGDPTKKSRPAPPGRPSSSMTLSLDREVSASGILSGVQIRQSSSAPALLMISPGGPSGLYARRRLEDAMSHLLQVPVRRDEAEFSQAASPASSTGAIFQLDEEQ